MLNKKSQQKYFRKRAGAIADSLKIFRKKHDEEALHKVRVETKKLKAAILLQSGSFIDEKLPDEFVEIKKLFKEAGKIREAGINIKLLEDHHVKNKKIRKEQEEIVAEKGKKFRKSINSYLRKIRKNSAFFIRKSADISDQKIQRLFNNEIRSLSVSSQVRLGPVQLHDCRKKLKNLLYIHSALTSSTAKKTKMNVFYLKKLEETIGSWHDVIIIIELLKKAGYTAKEIPRKLLAEKIGWRKKVNDLLIDFRGNALLS